SSPRAGTASSSTRRNPAVSPSRVSSATPSHLGRWGASSNRLAGRIDLRAVMKRYAIVVENAGRNLAAYVPDLPGCVATGESKEDVERLIREAIELHLEGMAEDGLPIPEPTSLVEYIEVEFR